jgi:hypothetical protein
MPALLDALVTTLRNSYRDSLVCIRWSKSCRLAA